MVVEPGRAVDNPYLDELLQTLWPAPARISRPGRLTRGGSGVRDFIAVPNDRRPRLLLPRRPHRVTAAGLRNYKSSASGRARLKLQVLAGVTRLGAADLLPSRVRVDLGAGGDDSGIDGYLSQVLGREVYVCLYIGPPRAVQKPVLQLLTPRGTTFGFAKIGTNPLTRRLVRSEGDALLSLAEHPWRRLSIPAVLHQDTWHGHEVLVQQALTATGPAASDPGVLTEAMVELSTARGLTSSMVSESDYWRQLHERLAALPASEHGETVRAALTGAAPTAAGIRLDFGCWHGDFAPWNISYAQSRVNVWDWEQFATGVPPGYDALHFRAQRALVQDGMESAAAMESALGAAAALLEPFGVGRSAADLVGLLYVVEIALRYLADGEVDAGTRMGKLQNWLSPVVTRQLDRLDSGVRR